MAYGYACECGFRGTADVCDRDMITCKLLCPECGEDWLHPIDENGDNEE